MMRFIFLASVLSACAVPGTDDSKTGESEYTWPGGTFQFSTTDADDACLMGDAEALFFPDGDESTTPWTYTIDIPSWEDLAEPEPAVIELDEPFVSTEATMRQGQADGQVVVRGIRQDGVIPNPNDHPDCIVDMVIDVLVTLDAADNVRGTATLLVEERSGAETCPEFVVPCEVNVEFAGLRAE